jgi:hypothetical protein
MTVISACLKIVLFPSPHSRLSQSLSNTPRSFAEGEPTSQRLSGDGTETRRSRSRRRPVPEVRHRLKLDASAVSLAQGMICLTSPAGLCRATEYFPRGVTGRGRDSGVVLLNPHPQTAHTVHDWGVVAGVVPNNTALIRARELASLYLKAPEVTRP